MSQIETIRVDEISDNIYDSLIETYNESQQNRVRGYLFTQSFREITKTIDSRDIIYLKAKRNTKEISKNISGFGPDYFSIKEDTKLIGDIEFSREKHGVLSADSIISDLDGNRYLYDIPVSEIVVRFESDSLLSHISDLFEEVFKTDFWVKQPFYAVLKSRKHGTESIKRKIKDFHPDEYFKKSGLGWRFRTLNLESVYTKNGWRNPNQTLFGNKEKKLSASDAEDFAINHSPNDDKRYGLINSKLLVNRFKSAMDDHPTGRSIVDIKREEWRGQWQVV